MPQYSKTTWVDGTAPAISAANLNKLEQGVFDSIRQDGSTTMSAQLVTIAGSATTPAIAPTGDSNTGIFFPAADTIAFGEGGLEAMRINSSGQVGIGTISPIALVSMHGAGQATSGAILTLRDTAATGSNTTFGAITFLSSPGTDFSIGKASENANSALAFRNANTGAEFMRITNAGNVGIGTTSPDVGTTGNRVLTVTGAFTRGRLQVQNTDGGNNAVAGTLEFLNQSYSLGNITMTADSGSGATGFMAFTTNALERMRITSTGNVGIGTTSPTTRLHVEEALTGSGSGGIIAATASSNGNAGIGFRTASTDVYSITTVGSAGSQNLRIRDLVNNATRVTLDSSGNVGIGTTSPSVKLQVVDASDAKIQSVRTGGCTVQIEGGGSAGFLKTTTNHNLVIGTNNADSMTLTTAGYLLIGYTSSNGAYPLQVNGQIFATSSTIATSDGKYKKDVVALDGALDIVSKLNPVQFSWKEHPVHKFNTEVPTVGFIAQEVAEALKDKAYLTSLIKKSECTWETETGETVEREVTRDVEKQVEREITEEIDGEEVTRTVTETVIEQVTEIITEPVKETHTEEFLGIAESNMIAILTKAIQELKSEVDALKAQLAK